MTPEAAERPGAGDAWERRRVRIARDIESVALELFAADGPDNVTVEQIAERAGISVRTFFRYFPSRDDVMLALPRRHVKDLCARVAARPANESVLEAFIAAAHEAQAGFADGGLARLWGRSVERWSLAKAPPRSGSTMGSAYSDVIAARLRVPADDLRVQVTAAAIAGVMWLAFLRWLANGDDRTLPGVVEESIQVLRDLDRIGAPGVPQT